MTISVPKTIAAAQLLQIIRETLELPNSLEGHSILLLNGRQIDSKNLIQINEGDTLSVLSPLAGG